MSSPASTLPDEYLARIAQIKTEQPGWIQLEQHLLSLGGDRVAMRIEDDLDALLDTDNCLAWPGEHAWFMPGRPNQCHSNAAALHKAEGHYVATGWALSDDGIWRQHSWCMHREDPDLIIETTVSRDLYYGFYVEGDALTDFLFYNY